MTLSQASSYSSDSFAIGASALLTALLIRESSLEAPRSGALVGASALLTALATTKLPLLAFGIPLGVLLCRRYGWYGATYLSAVLGIVLIWTVGFAHLTELDPGRAHEINPAAQALSLVRNPASIVQIASTTLQTAGGYYVRGLIGIFGWLDTYLDEWFYWTVSGLLSAALLAGATERVARLDRWSFAAATILAFALIFGALYLTWTPTGSGIVLGVQGRYFIPLLFPLAAAVAGLLPLRGSTPMLAMGLAVAIWALTIAHAPWRLMVRFYLSPGT
jgi:uncharacterized membrane protein